MTQFLIGILHDTRLLAMILAGAAAIANAIRDALGTRPLRFPVDPAWVREVLARRARDPVSSAAPVPGG